MRMVIESRPDPRCETASCSEPPLPLAHRGRSGSRSTKKAHKSHSRRVHDPGFNTMQWSSRVYWKDVTQQELRSALRDAQTGRLGEAPSLPRHTSSSCGGLQEGLQHATGVDNAPRSSFLLSSLIESKLHDHHVQKLDNQIAVEWEVVDRRYVDEEEYVML